MPRSHTASGGKSSWMCPPGTIVAKRVGLTKDIRLPHPRPQHIEAWHEYHTGCSHPRGCEHPAPVLSSPSDRHTPQGHQRSPRMKIVRYSQNGHAPRLGCFVGGDRVMDLAASAAAHLASRGVVRAEAIADALFPQS